MTIKTFPAHSLHCDVCAAELTGDDGGPWWFTDFVEARLCALVMRWIVTADQHAICDTTDTAHAAAITALMPPEPVIEVQGQLTLGEDADSAP